MSWDPAQYLQYEDARLRPALDLLARVALRSPARIVDLGCGAGNVTRMLLARWPEARVSGVDRDEAMLAKARAATDASAGIEWQQGDLADWRPTIAPDLVYSNAALHWLDDHERLFPRLFAALAPGGVLAVQMPANFSAASHRALHQVARSARWRAQLGDLVRAAPVASPRAYVEWLSPSASALDVWTTEYLQILPPRADGEHPVVAWMQGAALTPFVAVLPARQRAIFIDELRARVAAEYPARTDGTVIFPFRRIFIVAARSDEQA